MSHALYIRGGWPGHSPYDVAAWTEKVAAEIGIELECTSDIFALDQSLRNYDLIILGWNNALTTEDLTDAQEQHLLDAAARGTGIVGWHGAGSAFRSSLSYALLIGGSFLAHPAGEAVRDPYDVRITDHHHDVSLGVEDFHVDSEQYYMQVDPSNHVLAETEFDGRHWSWIDGVRMPVAWVRTWGRGRVFYCSIGHYVEDLEIPAVRRLIKQGISWAKREATD
jgi:uncharacterized protein